ncbi:hypothetical protein V1512DRAFT_15393 [Lipomyces arxii]|uniref:uncharacterized protein n=1 Tax=Lipomyces arxii TaxID=56418 RepID=UPI0034CEE8B7
MYWAQEPGSAPHPVMYPLHAPMPSYGGQYDYPLAMHPNYWNLSAGDYASYCPPPPEYYCQASEQAIYNDVNFNQHSVGSRTVSYNELDSAFIGENNDGEPWSNDETVSSHSRRNFTNLARRYTVSKPPSIADGQSHLDQQKQADPCNLCVRNLDDNIITNEDDLKALFSPYGNVMSVYLSRFPNSNISRGFGFVNYAFPHESARAKDALDGSILGRKEVYVNFSERKENYTPWLQSSPDITPRAEKASLAVPRSPEYVLLMQSSKDISEAILETVDASKQENAKESSLVIPTPSSDSLRSTLAAGQSAVGNCPPSGHRRALSFHKLTNSKSSSAKEDVQTARPALTVNTSDLTVNSNLSKRSGRQSASRRAKIRNAKSARAEIAADSTDSETNARTNLRLTRSC